MTVKQRLCVLVGLGFLVLPGCGGSSGDGGTTNPPPPPPPTEVAAEVIVGDDFFEDPDGNRNGEASVTIQVGETVRWNYSSGVRAHTVTSGEGASGTAGDGIPDGAAESIDSGQLNPGDTFEFTFETAGTWTYFCEIHSGVMFNATVIVEE